MICVSSIYERKDGRHLVVVVGGKGRHVYYARLLAAIKLGRPLLDTEVVHHVNGDPSDDRLENLMVLESPAEHGRLHRDDFIARIRQRFSHCAGCGADIDSRTPTCDVCSTRHSLRKRRGKPYVPFVPKRDRQAA